uniref:Protein BIG GRAIN 1-like B n=1 Tax=Davidia involucrata TaxID=16924 RepID=A0A5B7BXG3_DAVIN
MAVWDTSLQQDRFRNRRDREHPSFSSTLLDTIYRSIDEGEEELVLYRETMRKKHSNCTAKSNNGGFEDDARRACMIEKWMEKKVVVRRKSTADLERKSRDRDSMLLNSSSTSSNSSCGGGFSSSETESVYGGFTSRRPKPIRTSVSVQPEKFDTCCQEKKHINSEQKQKQKHEGGFVKTKSKVMKIYGDLKKVKQPISPGGRLASFLNSLFTAGNAKKAKVSSSAGGYHDTSTTPQMKYSKSANASTCSSASSFSRSCLSKTPSSRGKLSNGGMKRSVRFVDEDCQPCGHESSNLEAVKAIRNSLNEELQFHIKEKHRRVEEVARDLLRSYQKKIECEFDMRNVHSSSNNNNNNNEASDDDDDAASCASSDLFELDNLSAIGIERYREELPVYETTHLDTNLAIANGLFL